MDRSTMPRRTLLQAGAVGMALSALGCSRADAVPRWLTLPPTPELPKGGKQGFAAVNGIKMFHVVYGSGDPVIFVHGGLANSNYWGRQIEAISLTHQVIVADSRGHGRSTRDSRPFDYRLLASDFVALMDDLKLPKAAIVGWSDGAVVALDIAMNHADRLTKAFVFAANYNPSGYKQGIDHDPTFATYAKRAKAEYAQLSPTPQEFAAFHTALGRMWATQPNYSEKAMEAIKVQTLIVDGDHDEAIRRSHTEKMAALIGGAGLLIQPNVSHFSFLQDPEQFNQDVAHFLKTKW